MPVCRNIETTSQTGLEFMNEVADTLAAFTNYLGGTAVSVTGTDTITVTIQYLDCLTALPSGFSFSFVAAGSNSGPVTIAVNATDSAVTLPATTLLNRDGSALNAGALVGGTIYKVVYRSTENAYRLESEAAVAAQVGDIGNIPLPNVEEMLVSPITGIQSTGAGSWSAPFHCVANITIIGAGGDTISNGGGGGAGGTCRKTVELLSGETLNFNIGARGQLGPGGDTTLTGPNSLSMAAGGGQRGRTDGVPALGGNASGGDQNFTGGSGAAGSNTAGGTVGLIDDGLAASGTTQSFAHKNAFPFPFTCGREGFAGVNLAIGMGGGTVGSTSLQSGHGAVTIAYSNDLDA